MRKPRTTILLLSAMAAAFGLSNQVGRAGSGDVPSTGKEAVRPMVTQSDTSPLQESVSEVALAIAPSVPLGASIPMRSPVTKGLTLSTDTNALVSEMCSLHLLADKTDLSLSSQEWSSLATVVLQAQAIRQTYEARIATTQMIGPGQYRLQIPSYVGMGDALREKFHAELRNELGDVKAGEVLAKIGGRLEAQFAGFGVSMQTLEITANPGAPLSDVEVTRTVTYWNSVDGSDALTTRREIHFPAFEDPTGDSWDAFLARVKA